MLIPYDTSKMYFAYPIFIIGYEDAQFGANLTTCSSSYSLRDRFCFGLGSDTNAAAQLQQTKRCTINFVGPEHLDWIEYAGFHHAQEKLQSSHIPYELVNGCPILTQAMATLTLHIDSWQVVNGACHFMATITQRQVQDSMVVDGQFDAAALTPPLFAGDGSKRVYRTIAEGSGEQGKFPLKPHQA